MDGSCTFPHAVPTWAKVASAIFMTSVRGCVAIMAMTSVNLMSPSRKRASISSPPMSNWRSIAASVSKNGTSASSCTSRPDSSRTPPAGLFALLLLAALLNPSASAQDELLLEHVSNAVSVLQQLDELAGTCLSSLQEDAAGADSPCTQFLAAIDGELLAQYLANCAALNSWKDQYVAASFGTNPIEPTNGIALQLLVGTDYACGENALQLRTEFVTSAFARLQGGTALTQEHAMLERRLRELEFDATLTAERRLLQNSVLQQQLQRQRATERQMRQLDHELIRQQRN